MYVNWVLFDFKILVLLVVYNSWEIIFELRIIALVSFDAR